MKAPSEIYLQLVNDDGDEVGEVTWCQDRIYKADVKYIQVSPQDLRFAKGFERGQESIKRQNESGCVCIIDDDGIVVSVCGAHKEWAESL